MDRKQEIEARFGASADAYAQSPGHRGGPDLDRMVELAAPAPGDDLLDIATGAGNTALAFAPHVRRVVALDMADGMIATTRKRFGEAHLMNADFIVHDAEQLPFEDASFDIVTCRIAPHHFLDVERATHEVFRVLRAGGRYLVEDSAAPRDPTAASFLHDVESRRDATHVRSLTEPEWTALLKRAGFAVAAAEIFPKRHDLEAWLERGGIPEDLKAAIRSDFLAASPAVRRALIVQVDGAHVVSFTDEKVLLKAIRPG
ncbi:MAG: class I SAM-dependent methyltransferase [Actinomycetota bacterium]|nr:methyltransferase domain-containing protein [Actinomycetota bacterium]